MGLEWCRRGDRICSSCLPAYVLGNMDLMWIWSSKTRKQQEQSSNMFQTRCVISYQHIIRTSKRQRGFRLKQFTEVHLTSQKIKHFRKFAKKWKIRKSCTDFETPISTSSPQIYWNLKWLNHFNPIPNDFEYFFQAPNRQTKKNTR